jgi:hypothetical protein
MDFAQMRGTHFDKVFSSHQDTIGQTSYGGSFCDWFYMHQFDVDVAYLNSNMYYVNDLTMPPDFKECGPNEDQMICKL